MNHLIRILFYSSLSIFVFSTCNAQRQTEDLRKKAEEMAQNFLIIDTHIDLPFQLNKGLYDVSERSTKGHFDYARSIEGGLNSAFMSIYIPARYEEGGAKEHAEKLISIVENLEAENPGKFKVVTSSKEVQEHFGKNIITLPMGMENGSPIEGDLKNLEYFYNKGIRYITLCHTKNNHICDSSGEEEKKWNGLSPFGEEVINEMNRLGIMIDVSHVSDSTFYDVIRLSKVPVIASHSGCRVFTPGFERNMSDEMIKLLGENGGVMQVYFGTYMLNDDIRKAVEERRKKLKVFLEENENSTVDEFNSLYPLDKGSVKDIADHIDHVVNIAGIDHIGLGSDFDGLEVLPDDLKDASMIPNLMHELLQRGYTEEDIEKICSKNLLRVWKQAEDYKVNGKNNN
jgi:membrane dipeptidase